MTLADKLFGPDRIDDDPTLHACFEQDPWELEEDEDDDEDDLGWPMRCIGCGAEWFVDVGRLAVEVSPCICTDTAPNHHDEWWQFFDLDIGAWICGCPTSA